ncbi:unnamed protein product [Oikopleura dioica]|uniref:Uncharacterized protein n=1 Tax=Oikopleura dioica TaxID=34765 RepID=E4XRH1_OIKDI|nr:unnamed protein product [Oikopleura dioica]
MKEKNSQLRRHRHTPYIKPYSGPYSSKHVNFCDTQNHAKTCVLESDKHSLLSVISNNDNESKMSAKKMQWILRCQKVDENSEELQKIWKHREKVQQTQIIPYKEKVNLKKTIHFGKSFQLAVAQAIVCLRTEIFQNALIRRLMLDFNRFQCFLSNKRKSMKHQG